MKAKTEDFLKLNTLRGTKTAFLTPKRYGEHPSLLYGSPSGTYVYIMQTRYNRSIHSVLLIQFTSRI